MEVPSGRVLWSNAKGFKFVIFSGDMGLLATIAKEIVDVGGSTDSFETVRGLDDITGLTDWTIVPVPVEDVKSAAVLTLGALVVGKALGVHLHHEADIVVKELTRSIPAGPGR